MQQPRRRSAALVLLAALGALSAAGPGACTNAQLEVPAPPPVQALNDRLEIDGTYCTDPAAASVFPVKIVFLVDLSGSMCYTDPASGVCSPARCDQGPNNPATNPNPPRRVVAIQTILDKFANNPAVSFALVPFSSYVHVYPFDDTGNTFAGAAGVVTHLPELALVDSVTDYQGALSRVKALLSDDMAATKATRPSELPRTKYAVMFLTDGTPFPHCSRGDPTKNNPPDLPACAGDPSQCTICQAGFNQSQNPFPLLTPGQDYNEPYQLVQLVDEIHRLGDSYAVGDLKFHSVQLQVPNAAICCPVCFADDPDGSGARALLQQMAESDKGLGSYRLFTSAGDLSFVDYDFTSLQEDFVTRQLIVYNENEVATPSGISVDTDGDGIPDDVEFQLGTDPLRRSTMNDGYSDLFKIRHKDLGFDVHVNQLARCRAHSLKCPGQQPCDTDGDGLNDCEEFELGTDPELVDTDADGVPDGIEFKLGLDPLRDDTHEDLDFDGIRNIDEVLGFSSPTQPDTRLREQWAVETVATEAGKCLDAKGTPTGGLAYNFTVRGITLPTPQSRESLGKFPDVAPTAMPIGWSDTLLWMGEAPRGDARDYGKFRVACVRTRWIAPDLRLPLTDAVTLTDADFKDPTRLNRFSDCKGAQPPRAK